MQPEAPRAPVGPETLPSAPSVAGERIPALPTPENGLERGAERVEQVAEASAAASDAAAVGTTTAPAPTAPAADPMTTSPLVAADEDVIEKEWVDKAKKIIDETKDDPHGRSSRVSDLQRDYLQKRFGKVLGATNE